MKIKSAETQKPSAHVYYYIYLLYYKLYPVYIIMIIATKYSMNLIHGWLLIKTIKLIQGNSKYIYFTSSFILLMHN